MHISYFYCSLKRSDQIDLLSDTYYSTAGKKIGETRAVTKQHCLRNTNHNSIHEQ